MKYQIRFDWADHRVWVLPQDTAARDIDPNVRDWLEVAGARWVGRKFGAKEIHSFLCALTNGKYPWERPQVEVIWEPPPETPQTQSWVIS